MLPLILAVAVVGTGAVNPYSASTTGASICPAGAVVEGLDVSKYEGSIDWTAVKAAGIGFAIARISDGLNFPDATFDTNWAAMKGQGMVRGSYQYFEPAQDPVAQANMVLQHIGTPGPGNLPPVIDVETMGGVSAAAVVAGVKTWLATIQNATGQRPVVYASPSFWDGLGDPAVAADLWIAHWGVSCPSVPAAWSGWNLWQYTATGTVSGVPVSAVDRDRFNGSMANLLAYARVPAAAAITAPASGDTVAGTVGVTAVGNASTVRIELYADASLIGAGSSVSWDTTTVADGAHALTAKAWDAAGGSTTSAAVDVTVSNSSGGGGCAGLWPLAACPPPGGCGTSAAGFAGVLAAAMAFLLRRRRQPRGDRSCHAGH